nr:reverse transcriptase domain-containing protein [Tanacetum cinerariifolium]
MSTRSSARNLFPPLDNPELTIRRRSRVDPTLLNEFVIATDVNGDPPVPDLRTMKELCQPSLNGRGGPIASIAIHATNFGLKNDMIQQVQNSCQFPRLPGDYANKHLDKFLHVTQSIKVNGVNNDDLRLYLFPHSLIHHATAWFDRLPRNSINTFEQMAKMFLEKYFPPSMVTKLRNEITNFRQHLDESLFEHRDTINAAAGGTFMKRRPKECYDLIENMTTHHNDWDTSAKRSESSSSITSSFDLEIMALKAEMAEINKNLMKPLLAKPRTYMLREPIKVVIPTNLKNYQNQNRNQGNNHPQGNNQGRNQFFQGASHGQIPPPSYQAQAYQAPSYQAPVHQPLIPQSQVVTTTEFTNYMKTNDAILKNMQTNMTSLTNSNLELKNMLGQFMKMNTASSSGSGTLPSNTITNLKEDFQGITTRSGIAYQGPTIPTTSSSYPQVVERDTKVTKDTVPPTNNESTKDVKPSVVQVETSIHNSEPVVAPVSALKPNQKPSIPYPSRLHDKKLRDKANDQKEKFFQIFQDLNFIISFADALILMPKFSPTIKTFLTNKYKLYELARTPLNEHCSAVLLKKLPKKLGDPGKFLIPCDFSGMDECLALADLGASINLMPLSMWNKLSLPKMSPTCMTLELADRSISRPVRVAEDVFLKVGTFHFPADFVVVDFDADPRVPLILRRSFLKTGKALIDVYKGELTLRVGKEDITFNLDQTSRYSTNYNDMTANRIDVIDMVCKEYSQEVFGFSDVIASGNPTPYYDPIISTSSLTLTPFGDSDFLPEVVDTFLALEDDPTSSEVDHSYYDTEGDILLLKPFLNDDPSLPPPTQGKYFPQIQKELKICEAKNDKSSIDEPPEVELKDLPPHLEYAFLEGDDKLPIILAKDLSVEEKSALIKVLKSHKRAITWKLSNIKGINPEFYTHKILMGDDFKPAVQYQRRVNPKIHDVIKKEIEKLLDARLIYPISDSPWEKSHFMVKEGIVLGHKISKNGIEVDKAKIAWPMTRLLEKDTPFFFSKECVEAFQTLKRKLTEALILIALDWDLPFELMCDASDFAIGAVLGQRHEKHFRPIHYASKTMTEAESHYTMTKKEMLAVVYAFEKFRSYLIMNKSIVYTDHSALKYHFAKKDFKTRLLWWVLFLQEFKFKVIDTKGAENLAADHLSRLENPHQNVLDPKEINEAFPLETLNMVSFRGDSRPHGLLILKPLTFSRLAIMDPPGDTMARTTPPKRERFCNEMKCLRIPSKFVRFLTFGASISWGRSRLHEGTSIYSWPSTTCRNGSKQKRFPPTTPELFAKFLKSLFARFGTPRAIISDRDTHFCNDQFAKVMLKYGVTHHLATAFHPQTSGQVKVSNHGLKTILERAVGENRVSWSDKLDDALWGFRIAFKTPIGCTPYKLTASDHRKVQLNELNELRDQAYENSLIYKEKTKRLHDSKIKDRVFNVGDRVLLFNSRLNIFSGKLKTRWSGPLTITQVFPYGTIELSLTDGPNFKVNGHRLKHYFREDVLKMVVLDLQTFPKD